MGKLLGMELELKHEEEAFFPRQTFKSLGKVEESGELRTNA